MAKAKYSKQALAIFDALVTPGNMLANICFNKSQDVMLSESTRQTMRECYQAWDKAKADIRDGKVKP
jgi:hypothetical protein